MAVPRLPGRAARTDDRWREPGPRAEPPFDAHGYDTKYASHALRLGLQGIESAQTGRLTLPLSGDSLRICMEVKRGQVDFTEALARVDHIRARLFATMDNGPACSARSQTCGS